MSEKKINSIKNEESKSKRIKDLFEISEEEYKSNEKKLKINYNEKVFFTPINNNNNEELKKIIDVISQRGENTSINFNLNINNNYYNSNYNYVISQQNNRGTETTTVETKKEIYMDQENKEDLRESNKEIENESKTRSVGMTAYSLSMKISYYRGCLFSCVRCKISDDKNE
jgi:hypothetical protein